MFWPVIIALDFVAYSLREGHEDIPFLLLFGLFGAVCLYFYATEERT